jgi:hypothetical protein
MNVQASTCDGLLAPYRVPDRSSMSGDLGIFVYQPAESVATLEVQVGL